MINMLQFLINLIRRPAPADQPVVAPVAAPAVAVQQPSVTPAAIPTAPAAAAATRVMVPGLAATAGDPTVERDVRTQILNSFLSTPHGKLAEIAPLHASALDRDPLFYGHLAVWYAGRGEVRDHKVLFVAHLLTSDFPQLREVG